MILYKVFLHAYQREQFYSGIRKMGEKTGKGTTEITWVTKSQQ